MTATAAPQAHDDFLPLLPGVATHARLRFRGLNPADREEAVADAVAQAFVWFVRLKERGKEPSCFPVALAKYAALAVRCGRHVGRQLATRDALSWQARR